MTREEFNRFCSSLPATTHGVQWHESDVWKVSDKIFAICDRNDAPIPGITFKTSVADYELLREMPGLPSPLPCLTGHEMDSTVRYPWTD